MSTPKLCLVIDVEATCWERNPPSGTPVEDRKCEIIECGITTISIPDKKIVESRSIIVLPTTTEISDFCTQLTTLTPEFVEKNGISYSEALDILRTEYRCDRNMWASWGCYDRDIILRQCERAHIRSPFNMNYLNIKSAFCWKYGFNCGVKKALNRVGLKFDGTPHRGIDDSKMIAKIFLSL